MLSSFSFYQIDIRTNVKSIFLPFSIRMSSNLVRFSKKKKKRIFQPPYFNQTQGLSIEEYMKNNSIILIEEYMILKIHRHFSIRTEKYSNIEKHNTHQILNEFTKINSELKLRLETHMIYALLKWCLLPLLLILLSDSI